jgi:hypothetical protein
MSALGAGAGSGWDERNVRWMVWISRDLKRRVEAYSDRTGLSRRVAVETLIARGFDDLESAPRRPGLRALVLDEAMREGLSRKQIVDGLLVLALELNREPGRDQEAAALATAVPSEVGS